ncbi:putative lysr family regulatory protein [Rhypophila sp. PSN 637]
MFKSRRIPIPPVATDDVIPCGGFDDTRTVRSIIMGCAFRFNEVLDCDKIHAALARLLEIGEWRKLGGRLRLNLSCCETSGRLEIHVPDKFTRERPAVRYSHIRYHDIDMDQHPRMAAHFPHPTTAPSVQPGFDQYIDLLEPDQSLHTFEDYLCSDHPLLSLHALSFRDATVLVLKWPHAMTDATGRHALLKNWSYVLAGHIDKVQPLMGGLGEKYSDVTTEIAKLDPEPPSELVVAGHKRLTGIGMFLFIMRFIWVLLFGGKVVPRDEAQRDLFHLGISEGLDKRDEPPPRLSEGDILTAWLARLSLLSSSSTRSVAIMTVVDMRRRLPSIFGQQPSPTGRVWVQNLTSVALAHATVQSLFTNPLGETARHIRSAVQEQTTPEFVARYVRSFHSLPPGQRPGFILVAVSNWHCAKFFDVLDMSPAIVADDHRPASSGIQWPTESKPGKPVVVVPVGFSDNPELRNSWGVMGKDAAGNYWMQGMCTEATWKAVKKELGRLGRGQR